ncbi:MAG TPA: hypothetical protein VGH19_11795 [Verrucomicrobiae bacterium]
MKSTQTIAAFFGFVLSVSAFAQDAKPLLVTEKVAVIAAPTFKEDLEKPFSVAKGKWTVSDGVMTVLDLPEEKHIPVLHHKVGLQEAVIEVEFFLDGPGNFLVGCDGSKHIGRVVVNAGGLSIAEDSVAPSHTIAKLPLTVKPNEWHKLRVEWKENKMAANLDGNELKAEHEFLAGAKAQSWLAAGKSVKVRNLKISGVKTPTKP